MIYSDQKDTIVQQVRKFLRRLLKRKSILEESLRNAQEQLRRERASRLDLQRRLASYEGSGDKRDIDAFAHNEPEGMDMFFAGRGGEDLPEYETFAYEIDGVLGRFGVRLDGKSVFDAGVGCGSVTRRLTGVGDVRRGVGFDFSRSALERARERLPWFRLEQRDLSDPGDERYDVILCFEVLEHVKYPHVILRNLIGQLEKGGVLVLTVPEGRFDRSKLHINFWSPESWRLFISQHCEKYRFEVGTFSTRQGRDATNNFAVISASATIDFGSSDLNVSRPGDD